MVFIKLFFGWLFSIALVAGPYVALLVYFPDTPFWIHLTYWIVMVTYLLAAWTTNPEYDDTNLGWAGGLVDNPFSFEDDFNRLGLAVTLLLIPGKIVVWTLAATWLTLTGKAGGEA